jgi:hypothetical protein
MHQSDNGQKLATDFAEAMGFAVLHHWDDLSQDAQRVLFEAAASTREEAGDGEFRQALALFLHDHHPRTGPG